MPQQNPKNYNLLQLKDETLICRPILGPTTLLYLQMITKSESDTYERKGVHLLRNMDSGNYVPTTTGVILHFSMFCWNRFLDLTSKNGFKRIKGNPLDEMIKIVCGVV